MKKLTEDQIQRGVMSWLKWVNTRHGLNMMAELRRENEDLFSEILLCDEPKDTEEIDRLRKLVDQRNEEAHDLQTEIDTLKSILREKRITGDDEKEKLKEIIADRDRQILKLCNRINDRERAYGYLKAKVKNQNVEIAGLTRENKALERQRDELRERVEELTNDVDRYSDRIKELEDRIEHTVKVLGDGSYQ